MLQAGWRRRTLVRGQREAMDSAVKLQALWRGFVVRKLLVADRLRVCQALAAATIRRFWSKFGKPFVARRKQRSGFKMLQGLFLARSARMRLHTERADIAQALSEIRVRLVAVNKRAEFGEMILDEEAELLTSGTNGLADDDED